jgi:hypothetical protein
VSVNLNTVDQVLFRRLEHAALAPLADQVLHFVLRNKRRFLRRSDLEQPEHEVVRNREDTQHPPEQPGQAVDPCRIRESDPLRIPDCQGLRHQFTDHERDIGDDRHHHADGERFRRLRNELDGNSGKKRLEAFDGDHAAQSGGERADERHADLERGEKPLGLLLQFLYPLCGGIAALYQMPYSALPERDEGDLRGGEKAVQQDQEEDGGKFDE